MKSFQGLVAAALLLAAFAGCSDKSIEVKDKGSFSPIITGIRNNTSEPATRGIPNHLQVLVTNVNGYTLQYHWTATAGTFSDSTDGEAVWTPPDAVGTYDVTVAINTTDAPSTYYKTTTFHVYVDNEYTRWTHSDAVQFDPAPSTNNSLVFVELRNNVTGEGDVYRIGSPGAMPEQLSSQFFSVASPTPRGDEQQVAFAGRRRASESTSLWLMPWSGGDTLTCTRLARSDQIGQNFLAEPRFSWNGGFLMYASDSTLVTLPKLWYRDVINQAAPVSFMSTSGAADLVYNSYIPANWGPGGSNIAPPDSVVTNAITFYNNVGQVRLGAYKFETKLFGEAVPTTDVPNAWIADSTIAEPDWSSDGNYIVFSRRAPGTNHRDIWIIATNATDFSQAHQVTTGPADDSHPRFSKDGQTIYFVSNRQDNYGVNGIFATERRGTNLWAVRRFDRP